MARKHVQHATSDVYNTKGHNLCIRQANVECKSSSDRHEGAETRMGVLHSGQCKGHSETLADSCPGSTLRIYLDHGNPVLLFCLLFTEV